MKKALVRDGFTRIFEVAMLEFPVAPPLRWIDCADDVRPETHDFDGTTCVLRVVVTLTLDERAAAAVDAKDRVLFEVNFDQENRIRALELKLPITRAQYRDALIAEWKKWNI